MYHQVIACVNLYTIGPCYFLCQSCWIYYLHFFHQKETLKYVPNLSLERTMPKQIRTAGTKSTEVKDPDPLAWNRYGCNTFKGSSKTTAASELYQRLLKHSTSRRPAERSERYIACIRFFYFTALPYPGRFNPRLFYSVVVSSPYRSTGMREDEERTSKEYERGGDIL